MEWPLTPDDVATLNRVNELIVAIKAVNGPHGPSNFVLLTFSGAFGGGHSYGGHVSYLLNDKMDCGEKQFRSRDELVAALEAILVRATTRGRRASQDFPWKL